MNFNMAFKLETVVPATIQDTRTSSELCLQQRCNAKLPVVLPIILLKEDK
jgi:hypothetical protein